jgi:hypothetical protein
MLIGASTVAAFASDHRDRSSPMAIERGNTRTWTKSSHSGGSGACVEVRSPARDLLAVRDSKTPAGPRLAFAPAAWSAFLAVVGEGGPAGMSEAGASMTA